MDLSAQQVIYYSNYSLCSFLELQDFLLLVTGTITAKDRSIIVHFDDDTHGSIAVHTCSNEMHFLLGVFKEYEVFKMAMDAVVCAPDKKKYNII